MDQLNTERLLLRPVQLSDTQQMLDLLNDPEVGMNTGTIPYPYKEIHATTWIEKSLADASAPSPLGFYWAMALSDQPKKLIGAVSLKHLNQKEVEPHLGFWLGKPYWGQGFTTEACIAVIQYGFEKLKLPYITAAAFKRNERSQRVLEKVGFQQEGDMVKHFDATQRSEDSYIYQIDNPKDSAKSTKSLASGALNV